MPKYIVKNLTNGNSFTFEGLNEACTFAASDFAERHGLPKFKNDENRYSLTWDVILRDRTYSRIYKSSCGGFLIIAKEI